MLLLQANREPELCGMLMVEHATWTDEVISACCRNEATMDRPCKPLSDASSCRKLFPFDKDWRREAFWKDAKKANKKLPVEQQWSMKVKKMCLSLDQMAGKLKEPIWSLKRPPKTRKKNALPKCLTPWS